MKKIIFAVAAFAVAVPAAVVLPVGTAEAQSRNDSRYYKGTNYSKARYIKKCRKSDGTTGLVGGGVAGAVLGSEVIGGGLAGVAAGAVGGALAGRAIDRTVTAKERCVYIRRR